MGISLDVSNSWKSYKSADIKSNVFSLINDVKEDFSSGINNVKQSLSNTSTMVVDLSQKVEEKFDAGWDTVKSSFSSAVSTLGEQVNNLKTGAQNLRESFNSALNNAKKKTDEFTNNLEQKLISAGEWVADKENWKKVGATITVGVTSVLTGIADLGEKLVDGVTWCGAKIVEGVSFVVAKIQEKTGHEEAAKKTMDWRENMKTDVANWIATDYVQNFNKYIYEETKLGQAINADSWLKYDSKVAQGISSVTEKIAEFVAATAVTVATGGAAAPAAFAIVFGTGFLAGVGGSAEKNYATAKANGEEVSIDDKNLNVFIDGVGSGFSWYAQGKLGQGMVQAAKAISKVGAKTFGSTMLNGFKETLSSLKGKSAKEVISTIFTKSNLKTQLFSADNLSDSGGVVADNVASWINGDEEFNLKSVLGAGAELLGTSLLNIITGGIVDNASKIDDVAKNADEVKQVLDDDTLSNIKKEYNELLNQKNQDWYKYTKEATEKGWVQDLTNVTKADQIDDRIADVLRKINSLDVKEKANLLLDLEIKNSKLIMKSMDVDDMLDVLYEQEKLLAKGKYNATFASYREHAMLHTEYVKEYAIKLAAQADGININEVKFGAMFHDLGMKGGYYFDDNGILCKIDDITDSFKAGNKARKNHPLNSALNILAYDMGESVGESTERLALLAMSHSKSTSGIKHMNDPEEWLACIDKLEDAIKQSDFLDDFDLKKLEKLREYVNDSQEFNILRKEAMCIRDGDAMSMVARDASGNTIMQTGATAETTVKPLESYDDIPEKTFNLKDYDYDSPNPTFDGVENIEDILISDEGKTPVKSDLSKIIHAGENNVDFNSRFNGSMTDYKAVAKIDDPLSCPQATMYSINERIGEAATYSGCERDFKIELPKEMEDSPLAAWYEKSLQEICASNTSKDKKQLIEFIENTYKKKGIELDIGSFKGGIDLAKLNDIDLLEPSDVQKIKKLIEQHKELTEFFDENIKIIYK